jgi:hypothetical protein
MELKPVRDFRFAATWCHNETRQEFEVRYENSPIGTVWQRTDGQWSYRRHEEIRLNTKKFKNRIGAARALADEPSKKRGRRKGLTASRTSDLHGDEFWNELEERLRRD